MRTIMRIAMTLATIVGMTTVAAAATYQLDKAHTSVDFKVKHMAISWVSGAFRDFDGSFEFEPGKPESWRAEAVIQVPSIDTGNEDRDKHLRSEDFFFAEKYPTITFRSTGVEMTGEDRAKLKGDLTIRGITKPIELDMEIVGMVTDPWGNNRAGFSADGVIDRKDFGLQWNKALETGGLVVGNEVKIHLEIEGIMQK
jgi:polyisoprenoid-binding protein YceI